MTTYHELQPPERPVCPVCPTQTRDITGSGWAGHGRAGEMARRACVRRREGNRGEPE